MAGVGGDTYSTLTLGTEGGTQETRFTGEAQKVRETRAGALLPLCGALVPGVPRWSWDYPLHALFPLASSSARSPIQKLQRGP